MPENKFYVTTSIPYVNAPPHIGHAFEFVQADVLARYHRLRLADTFLVTGADENSLKNVKAAQELKISTQELVDRNAMLFKNLAEGIGLLFDVFLRSSGKERHWPGVEKLWKLCEESGDIYKKRYKGLYCVGCELFYTDGELIGGLCPVHKVRPEPVEEENYFFRLSKYQKQIEQLIESDRLGVYPQGKKNEVLSFVRSGLEDFSVSRSVARAKGWGIPVPGDDTQIMYVWLDALCVYLTGVGFGSDEMMYRKFWPADVHVIGKDIIRFHAVYWPAILLSAKLEIPKRILVHGFLTIDGQKMSKSIGNVIDPLDLLKRYSADELRYYLMRDMPAFDDGDFSEKALKDRINKELLGDIGNLVNRVLTLAEKSGFTEFCGANELGSKLDIEDIEKYFEKMEPHEALNRIMDFVRACNKYVNDKEPWKLSGDELSCVLYNLLESIRVIAMLLYPFIPSTSTRISEKLGFEIKGIDTKFEERFTGKLNRGDYLFKHVD